MRGRRLALAIVAPCVILCAGAGARAQAARPPALAQLADAVVERLASAFPSRSGRIVRVAPPRVLVELPGVAAGDILEVYAPEAPTVPAAAPDEQHPVSLFLLGKVKVASVSAEGAWAEPQAPLLAVHLAPDQVVRARRGPRRVGLSTAPVSGPLQGVAAALAAILPERLRARGFAAVDSDVVARGSLLQERAAAERALEAHGLDHEIHLIATVRGTQVGIIGELVSAGTAGAPPQWDIFSADAASDAEVAALLGPARSESPGLRVASAMPLPDRPLAMASGGGVVSVLTGRSLLRFRARDGQLTSEGSVELPSTLPEATAPARAPAGTVAMADLDGDGRIETYVTANWLRYPYRILPVGNGGALESIADGVVGIAAGGGYLSGTFQPGSDALGGDLALHVPGKADAVRLELPFTLLRAVRLEADHFLLLTTDYELSLLRPEAPEVTPLSSPRRTGYAFDVAYDSGGGRTVLACSSLATHADRVVLQGFLPPGQSLGRAELPGVAEAVLLTDVDQDGRIELLVAEGSGDDGAGVNRLVEYATDLLAAAPAAQGAAP